MRRDGEWPTTDGLGNTRVVTNGSQSVTSNQLPDAYGQTVSSGGSTSVPYQWGGSSGYRSDLDAGLVQVGARYYDRDSGRFISRDTDLGQSPYAYCNDDPINHTDPSGHSWLSSIFKGIGRAIGSIGKSTASVFDHPIKALSNYAGFLLFYSTLTAIFVGAVAILPSISLLTLDVK